jgi:pimeloyl-ACP methyl ester carboxylesterase
MRNLFRYSKFMNAYREFETAGARLRYRDEGTGPSVVLVHGWTLDLEVWEPQTPLTAYFRMVRYDRRGFGLSSGHPSVAQDVADLRALLDELGLQRPLLVGMSQGARVVLEFAARHPGVARGLVLDGPPSLADNPAPIDDDLPLAQMQRIALREGLPAFLAMWRAHPLTRLVTTDPRMHAMLDRILARYPGRDLLNEQEPSRETIPARMLAQVHTPVLIINGARDTEYRRRAGQQLLDSLAHAERVLIPDAAHLPNLDAPRAYNQLMYEFSLRILPAAA